MTITVNFIVTVYCEVLRYLGLRTEKFVRIILSGKFFRLSAFAEIYKNSAYLNLSDYVQLKS